MLLETASRRMLAVLARQSQQLPVPAATPTASNQSHTRAAPSAPAFTTAAGPGSRHTSHQSPVTQSLPLLLAVVSEKTGYPVEMLDLDMGLDADLGIDSIKRVEILSAIQEKLPDAPLIGPEHLGSLQTLGEIAAFLSAGAAPAARRSGYRLAASCQSE